MSRRALPHLARLCAPRIAASPSAPREVLLESRRTPLYCGPLSLPIGQVGGCARPYTERTVDARYIPLLIRLPDTLDVDDPHELTAYVAHLLEVLERGGVIAGVDERDTERVH